MALGPKQSPPFSVIKVLSLYDHTHLYIIVYGCFTEELRSCGKNWLKKQKLLSVPLQEKIC